MCNMAWLTVGPTSRARLAEIKGTRKIQEMRKRIKHGSRIYWEENYEIVV